MDKLSQETIVEKLNDLPEWSQIGETLQRTFKFGDFVAAKAFVDRVADLAEAQQHHPDILIRYDKVTFTLSTHDAGGITDKDIDFAHAMESATAAA